MHAVGNPKPDPAVAAQDRLPVCGAVIRGEGQVAKERMAARIAAWEDGAWVREAALAHAETRAAG